MNNMKQRFHFTAVSDSAQAAHSKHGRFDGKDKEADSQNTLQLKVARSWLSYEKPLTISGASTLS